MWPMSELHKDMLTNRDLVIKETMWHFHSFTDEGLLSPDNFCPYFLYSVSKQQHRQNTVQEYCYTALCLCI